MQTFVLVHGGWLGGWCWRDVAKRLRADGHLVYTPTLTGLGERSHLMSPQITLKTHAQDVLNVLHYENLSDVVLLGHSYSGMVISQLYDLDPSRVGKLVYLDAFVPDGTQSLEDMVGDVAFMAKRVAAHGFGWLNPPPGLDRWHISDPAMIEQIAPRLTPHPFGVNREPVCFPETPGLPCVYVSLTRDQKPHFIRIADRLKLNPSWRHLDLNAGHMVMLEEPEKLSNLLLTQL